MRHLRSSPFCGPIGLWGRSMGAVTALLYADSDPSLGAICVDSPFASLRTLAEELARSNHIPFMVPSWLVGMVLLVIRLRVKTLADFDIEDIVPLEHARRSFVPAMFVHAQDDTFIAPKHSRDIYDAYAGDKEFVIVQGDHNTERRCMIRPVPTPAWGRLRRCACSWMNPCARAAPACGSLGPSTDRWAAARLPYGYDLPWRCGCHGFFVLSPDK